MFAFCVFVFAFYVVSVSVVGWEKRRVLYQEPLSFVFCFFFFDSVAVCFVARMVFVCYFAFFSLTLLRCVLCQEWFLFVILLSSALLWCFLCQEWFSCVILRFLRLYQG